MQVTVTGVENISKAMDEATEQVRGIPAQLVEPATIKVTKRAKEYIKEKDIIDTRTLSRSVSHKISKRGDTVTGTVGTWVEYAPYHEYGTGIYNTYPGATRRPITPKRAKRFLTFVRNDKRRKDFSHSFEMTRSEYQRRT